MYRTTITLAGLNICVEHKFEGFRDFAKDFITDFDAVDFNVSVSNEDIEIERKLVEKQKQQDGQAFSYTDVMLEETAVYRKIADNLIKYNAVVFHGSAVAVGEKAVLFTALSGVGKTTHTKLWLKNIKDSFVLDGDKPILRFMNDTLYVCGTPWNGKEHMGCNKNVPLTAICKINRSETNRIEKPNPSAFIPTLLEQMHRTDYANQIRILEQIAKTIPLYNLYCNMEDGAALLSFREMMR